MGQVDGRQLSGRNVPGRLLHVGMGVGLFFASGGKDHLFRGGAGGAEFRVNVLL